MRLLLDTHTLLWWLNDDSRLTPDARAAIASLESEVFVSLATCWEIAVKVAIGKLKFPVEDLAAQLTDNQFQHLSITLLHVNTLAALPLHHRDPFDRMLISQALAEKLPWVSGDRIRDKYAVEVLAV